MVARLQWHQRTLVALYEREACHARNHHLLDMAFAYPWSVWGESLIIPVFKETIIMGQLNFNSY